MKAIVIDDEQRARNLLTSFVKNIPEITTFYEASSLAEGVALIKKHRVQLVFLDIKMPKESGLEIVRYFEDTDLNFKIIFTTAYDQYALEAFKLSASNYLLKPIDADELMNAVEQVASEVSTMDLKFEIQNLKNAVAQISKSKIAIEVPKGIMLASYDDIVYLEADGMYTKLYFKDEKVKTICKPLKHFVEQLKAQTFFFYCHRSYLINLKYVKELTRLGGDLIVMENGKKIPISKSKRDTLIEVIHDIF